MQGIAGHYFAHGNRFGKIINCYSTGKITGRKAAGIAGHGCTSENTSSTIPIIKNCFSTGDMDHSLSDGTLVSVSGIAMPDRNCNLIIEDCYSTGNGLSTGAGGICGRDVRNGLDDEDPELSGTGTLTIRNCFYIR